MSEAAAAVPGPHAGDALVAVARQLDAGPAFGIVSVHNQPLVDAMVADGRYVAVRHEATTVNAADGYSRVSGRLGIAITSTGTGAGNAAGSLIESLTAGSAVLHVTGQIDSIYLGLGRGVIHETKDQRLMLDAVSKAAYTVRSLREVGPTLAAAARRALDRPSGPVSVEIPVDLQYGSVEVVGVPPPGTPTEPDGAALAAACDLLGRARRPLVWIGGGARAAGAQIAELVARTGAGVLSSGSGRGVLSEDEPFVVGNFAAHPEAADLLSRCDLLVSIGTHFRSNETRHYRLALPRPHVQIDVDEQAIGRVHPADVGIVGDAGDVLDRLAGAMRSSGVEPGWRREVAAARAAVRASLRASIGPHAVLCDALRDGFDPRSPMVRDVTIPASSWGNRLLPILDPATNVSARGGGIGQGLGMALGASLARPDVPTMLMVGDGGLAVHIGELMTIAEQQPWLVVVLFNDGGYGVLRNLQDRHFGRRSGVDLRNPDFAALAASADIDHLSIGDAADVRATIDDAVGRRRPVIVEVDCHRMPMPDPFVPPVPVPGR